MANLKISTRYIFVKQAFTVVSKRLAPRIGIHYRNNNKQFVLLSFKYESIPITSKNIVIDQLTTTKYKDLLEYVASSDGNGAMRLQGVLLLEDSISSPYYEDLIGILGSISETVYITLFEMVSFIDTKAIVNAKLSIDCNMQLTKLKDNKLFSLTVCGQDYETIQNITKTFRNISCIKIDNHVNISFNINISRMEYDYFINLLTLSNMCNITNMAINSRRYKGFMEWLK